MNGQYTNYYDHVPTSSVKKLLAKRVRSGVPCKFLTNILKYIIYDSSTGIPTTLTDFIAWTWLFAAYIHYRSSQLHIIIYNQFKSDVSKPWTRLQLPPSENRFLCLQPVCDELRTMLQCLSVVFLLVKKWKVKLWLSVVLSVVFILQWKLISIFVIFICRNHTFR